MEWKKDDAPVRLTYKVILKGASARKNFLRLVLDPAEGNINILKVIIIVWLVPSEAKPPAQVIHNINIFTFELVNTVHVAGANKIQDRASGSKENPTIPGKPELKPKLKDLMCALNNVADEWMTLGVQLDIPKPELNTIELKCQRNPKRCLLEMLENWLQLQVDPPPSWTNVVNAVESLGNKQLGEELRKQHGIP